MKQNAVKSLLKSGQPAVGTWLSLGSITASRFLARSGFHWLTIDAEHSLVGMETTTTMMALIAEAGCVPLVRVPCNRHDHIKRVLDNGAFGVVVPMVNSRQEALEAVSACLYPPRGTRSVGGNAHALNWQATPKEYYSQVDDQLLIVLQCEHIDAVRQADEIFSVPGIDAIFVGPNDLQASMRTAQGSAPDTETFEETLQAILAACKRQGVAAGIHTFSIQDAQRRIAEGWQFIAVGSDLKMMVDNAGSVVEALKLRENVELAKY